MDLPEIERHWKAWADEYKADLRATTKTPTIKELEVAALHRAFRKSPDFARAGCRVLEVGCGNGHNCFRLFDRNPHASFTGVDFIPEMIASARERQSSDPRYRAMRFVVGNVLELDGCAELEERYEVVFTDRCLINLNSHELQAAALDQLCRKTADGGHVVLIENVLGTHREQNRLRESVGLSPRQPAEFNRFLDETRFLAHAAGELTLLEVEDFASLHDVVLYVLVPMLNDGEVDYDAPVVRAATELLLSVPEELRNGFGSFGQNRLYLFKKVADEDGGR